MFFNAPSVLRVFNCHFVIATPIYRGKQSLKAIVRLLRGACPERHETLRCAQSDRKRRARNDR
jgi:hypothetical protein